jgi:hypothetical protein
MWLRFTFAGFKEKGPPWKVALDLHGVGFYSTISTILRLRGSTRTVRPLTTV